MGARTGFGQSFEKLLKQKTSDEVYVASRKSDWSMDFSKKEKWDSYIEEILSKDFEHLVYFAGGGPFGDFSSKQWKDHEWSFRVNFEFPAYILHKLSEKNLFRSENLTRQIVFIGSSIAESAADPKAASYCAGKHALKGLILSLHAEKSLHFDLRLFSPGYMDTKMLPANAWPRQEKGKVQATDDISLILFNWLKDRAQINTHLVID